MDVDLGDGRVADCLGDLMQAADAGEGEGEVVITLSIIHPSCNACWQLLASAHL